MNQDRILGYRKRDIVVLNRSGDFNRFIKRLKSPLQGNAPFQTDIPFHELDSFHSFHFFHPPWGRVKR